MRAGITSIVTFVCCLLCIVTVLTIGSYNLQRDELERAVALAAKQTARQCLSEGITDNEHINLVALKAFDSHISSKKGTLVFYVLYADRNIVDIAANFTYKQYNGTEKTIVCRKTYIRDWVPGVSDSVEYRFINLKYLDAPADAGGLQESSWHRTSSLRSVLENTMDETGKWTTYQSIKTLKQESAS